MNYSYHNHHNHRCMYVCDRFNGANFDVFDLIAFCITKRKPLAQISFITTVFTSFYPFPTNFPNSKLNEVNVFHHKMVAHSKLIEKEYFVARMGKFFTCSKLFKVLFRCFEYLFMLIFVKFCDNYFVCFHISILSHTFGGSFEALEQCPPLFCCNLSKFRSVGPRMVRSIQTTSTTTAIWHIQHTCFLWTN